MRQHLVISMIALAIPINAAYAQATPPGTPVKPSPATLSPSLGAIHRSNPVIVRPPEPNSAEQSYSRNQGFVTQHGTRPDPRVSTVPSQKK